MIQKNGTDKLDSAVLKFYRDEQLSVDLRDRVVLLDSRMLTLTRMEYSLLELLVEHAGEVVPRRALLMLTPTVDVHLWRLRKKLGVYADQYLETVVDVGCRFRPMPGR
jgi:DNA-binding response OmpR family regulator